MDSEADSTESPPAGFLQLVCPEILYVSVCGSQCTDEGHYGHEVAKVTDKGIDHGFFILAASIHIPADCTSVS